MSVDLDALREGLARTIATAYAFGHPLGLECGDGAEYWRANRSRHLKEADALIAAPILSDLIAKAGRVEAAEAERDEARSKQAVPLTEEQIEARRNRAHDAVDRRLRAERDAALARATAAEAEIEGLRAALRATKTWIDTELPAGTPGAGTAHKAITEALDATQPDRTEARR